MDTRRLPEIVRGLTRERLAELVAEVAENGSPEEQIALAEAMPRQDVADPSDGDPADFAAALDPTYRRRPHVDALAAAVRETVEQAQDGSGSGRLIVSMPPQVGKSYTASLWTPAWFLARHPDRQVILASHEDRLAVSFGRQVRDTLRRYGEAGQVQVRIARDVAAAGEWETSLGGGMLSRGIGGSITGRGGHLLVIDDPIKDFAQAHSHAIRKAHWDWWLSTAQTRLRAGSVVLVVMTRWHEDDLAGRLTSDEWEGDPDEWRVLRIPALGEGSTEDVADGRVAPDALDRDEGVPLTTAADDEDPDEAGARWERTRRSVGPYVWAGLYQQRPSEPEGTILRRAWWQFYSRVGERLMRPDGSSVEVANLRIYQSWDMAFKDKATSDWVVGQVWGALGQGDRFLLAQVRGRMDFVETKRAVRQLRSAWPSTEATWIEDKANGPAIIAELRREISGLVPHNPRESKEARAWATQGDLEAGSIWLPAPEGDPWVRDFIEECAAFPNGSHDDQVDAYTQAILRMRRGETEIRRPTGSRAEAQRGMTPATRRTIRRA